MPCANATNCAYSLSTIRDGVSCDCRDLRSGQKIDHIPLLLQATTRPSNRIYCGALRISSNMIRIALTS